MSKHPPWKIPFKIKTKTLPSRSALESKKAGPTVTRQAPRAVDGNQTNAEPHPVRKGAVPLPAWGVGNHAEFLDPGTLSSLRLSLSAGQLRNDQHRPHGGTCHHSAPRRTPARRPVHNRPAPRPTGRQHAATEHGAGLDLYRPEDQPTWPPASNTTPLSTLPLPHLPCPALRGNVALLRPWRRPLWHARKPKSTLPEPRPRA
jgi:hypothetical protein